jgi:hypothetical protein
MSHEVSRSTASIRPPAKQPPGVRLDNDLFFWEPIEDLGHDRAAMEKPLARIQFARLLTLDLTGVGQDKLPAIIRQVRDLARSAVKEAEAEASRRSDAVEAWGDGEPPSAKVKVSSLVLTGWKTAEGRMYFAVSGTCLESAVARYAEAVEAAAHERFSGTPAAVVDYVECTLTVDD